ncbi:MAG TPA: helix-turn-helix domain-containing protein [Acidimicrobiia bacterium]|jgi:AcrR family transcriptional regulator
MENLVSTLADRALAERHETYAVEIRTLLDAALTVMQRSETIDPRVSDIVRTAGLSNQAFYRHFRGKDELLVALLDDGRQRLLATIERRMTRATGPAGKVRAWIEVVLAQARDPEAAAATRPFAINGDRLAVQFPDETRRSRDRLVDPLRAVVDEADALAIYHVTMGTTHDALVLRHTPTRAEVEQVVAFSLRGCGIGT